MENPCNICLVTPCCTSVCKEKYRYTDFIVNELTNVGYKVYDERGGFKKNISPRFTNLWAKWTTICEKNKIELETIHNRDIMVKLGV
jgi:hypothetical protein